MLDILACQPKSELIEEGRRVRDSLIWRSAVLLSLFDYLLEQSRLGSRPREADIAETILGGEHPGVTGAGSSVRFYMFRLRKKLDQYYAARPGPRIVIPRGEFAMILADPGANGVASGDPNASVVPPRAPGRVAGRLGWKSVIAALLMINALVTALVWLAGRVPTSPLAQTAFWRPVATDHRPITIVVGDYFLYGEMRGGNVNAIVRDLAIATPEDLHRRAIGDRGYADRAIDLGLAYVSSNTVYALRSLWVALQGLRADRQGAISLIPASQLDPDILKMSNIIYVGPLDGLGQLLANPLSRASNFALPSNTRDLVDKSSGRRYRSDFAVNSGPRIPRRDYGYIASLQGPAGNSILIISGAGDAGITQMADLVSNKAALAELAARIGPHAEAFEALYQVRAMYSQSYGRNLITARKIGDQGVWDTSADSSKTAADESR